MGFLIVEFSFQKYFMNNVLLLLVNVISRSVSLPRSIKKFVTLMAVLIQIFLKNFISHTKK